MSRFLKLLNFEISRFILVFSLMMGAIVAIQLFGVYVDATSFVDVVNNSLKSQSITLEQYAKEYMHYSLEQSFSSLAFMGPILFGISVLVLYVFFIWYRDWFGKATFSYRLLTLPMHRIQVYFVKLVTLLLFIFTALVMETIVIYLISVWVQKIIPSEVYLQLTVQEIYYNDLLILILPSSLGLFVFNYIIGIAAVTVVFTCILFERSYRLKGVLYAIGFALLAGVIMLLPIIYQTLTSLLFMNEMYIVEGIVATLVGVLSIVTANYLLKYKINV